jgi:hypothetical protein
MATIGATAPSSNTVNYDALLTATLFNYRPVMVDNIFKSSAALAALRKYGGIRYVDGGERIQELLMYGSNDTFKSYRGYESLTLKPQDGMTSAFFPWSEIGGTIVISRLEERQNSGESRILSLLEQKVKQAEMSIKELVNTQVIQGTVSSSTFVPGNSAKDLFPLGYFLPKDNTASPVAGGEVGNIARGTYSWWRPHTATFGSGTKDTGNSFALSVSTYAGLRVGLYRMYNYCSRGAGGDAPNIVICNQETYETYENSLDQLKRYYQDDDLVSMGFDNIKLKGATMIWDELVPDIYTGTAALTKGSAFFLNTNYYKLVIDKETDFITTPFLENQEQTARAAKCLFMGQATVNNLRKLGVCYNISLSITS